MKGTAFDLQRTRFKASFRKCHRQPQTQLATRLLAARLDVRKKQLKFVDISAIQFKKQCLFEVAQCVRAAHRSAFIKINTPPYYHIHLYVGATLIGKFFSQRPRMLFLRETPKTLEFHCICNKVMGVLIMFIK